MNDFKLNLTSNKKPKLGDIIAVWFSCGAASAVAAKKTIEKYGNYCTVRVLNNPVIEEDEDDQRFLKDCEKWLGIKIEKVINPSYPSCSAVDVWDSRKYMSGIAGAPCTLMLKKNARYHWEKTNHADWHVLGFTMDEKRRHERFILSERDNVIPVLIDEQISKGGCYNYLSNAGIEIPNIYKMGYPNANCIGCVKASSPTYWNHVRVQHPEIFASRAEQSKRIGAKLVVVKGERMFLSDLDPDTKGRKMKDMDFECSIFCEEKQ